jgi:hypothetical protein
LGGFDALRQNFGVRFEEGGFVEFQPLVLRVHLVSPYTCWEDIKDDLSEMITRGAKNSTTQSIPYAGVHKKGTAFSLPHDFPFLYQGLRIETKLRNESGNGVRLKQGAHVDVSVEADA